MGEFEIARAMIEDVRKAVTVPRPVEEAPPNPTPPALAEEGTTA
jgi:hypothetical protein